MNASACWSIQRRSNWNVLRVRCVRFWIVDRIICEKKAYRHEKQTVMERLNPGFSRTLHCHRLIEWRELSCSSLRMWFGLDEETFDSNCDQRYWGMFGRKNKRFASDCWWLYWSGFYRKLEEKEESMALSSETSNWHRSQSRLNASMAKREKHHWMITTRMDFRFRSSSLKCMIIFQRVSLDHGSIVCWVTSSFDQIETIFLRNARSICAHWFLFSAERIQWVILNYIDKRCLLKSSSICSRSVKSNGREGAAWVREGIVVWISILSNCNKDCPWSLLSWRMSMVFSSFKLIDTGAALNREFDGSTPSWLLSTAGLAEAWPDDESRREVCPINVDAIRLGKEPDGGTE